MRPGNLVPEFRLGWDPVCVSPRDRSDSPVLPTPPPKIGWEEAPQWNPSLDRLVMAGWFSGKPGVGPPPVVPSGKDSCVFE